MQEADQKSAPVALRHPFARNIPTPTSREYWGLWMRDRDAKNARLRDIRTARGK